MVRQRHPDAAAAPKKRSEKKRATKKVAKKKSGKKTTAKKAAKKAASQGKSNRGATAKKKAAKKTAKKASKRGSASERKSNREVKVDAPIGLFTQERVDLLLELVGERCYMAWEAAPKAKMTDRTLRRWLARGRAHQEDIEAWQTRLDEAAEEGETQADIERELGPCPQPNQWSEFAVAFAEAELNARELVMGNVRREAMVDPKIGFMWLERRYPRDFGNAATRPGIGNNAGGDYDPQSTGASDPTVELESAIASFLERAAETVDPVKTRPE